MGSIPDYKNKDLSFEVRARDLVSRMTLEEKVMQMLHSAPELPRLGIKAYNWWNEALHGVARAGTATVFPQAIGMAATFDEEQVLKTADIIATEGRAKYHEAQRYGDGDIYKGLTFWAPNVNIFRDPRWGRGHETFGEDPYLTTRLGVAFVRGLQGEDKKYLKTAACAKHYAVHSGPEKDRHSFNAVATEKDMRETYLPAFKECVKTGKVEAVMGAYNRTNGEPCCGSKTLLKDILREEWGFQGHVTSDCWAIKDFHEEHMVTRTAPESVALAVNSGCDLNCGNMYINLLIAHKEGLVTETQIDQSVTRLMVTRMKLGMFDEAEEVPYTSIPYEVNDCEEHRRFSLELAKKSLVLLKNENMLPLDRKKIRSIAVIGPNADSRSALIGNYFGTASKYTTVLEGIHNSVEPGTRVYYSAGCHLFMEKPGLAAPRNFFGEAVAMAQRSDVVVLCLGLDATLEGEQGDVSNEYAGGDKPDLNLPGHQQELLEAVYKAGKPVILILMSGSALAVNWADEHIPAIVQAWYPGAEGGKAIAELLFGEFSPSGKLPVTFYRTTEELPGFCDYSMKGRTYRYMKNEALYPFGYGLGYSKFQFGEIKIFKESINVGEEVSCEVTVENIGKYEADEIVQLYLEDVEASVEIPRWQLAGIRRLHLKPGEAAEIIFTVSPRQMALIDNEGSCVLEPGFFNVYVSGNQPDERSLRLSGNTAQKAGFCVTGERTLIEY